MPVKLIVQELGGSEAPRVEVFDQPIIIIGRSASTHLHLPDQRMVVSKRHAELRQAETLQLVDLGSKNYTYLDGHRLLPHRPVVVRSGSVIRIGDFEIQVLLVADGDTLTGPGADSGYNPRESVANMLPPEVLRPAEGALDAPDTAVLRRAVRELILLNDLAREIGASMDTREILNTIVQYALRAVQARQGVISLVNEQAADPMTTLVRRLESPDELYRVNQGVFAWMMNNKMPLLVNNPLGSTQFDGIPWTQSVQSLLCVPLLVRSELMGMLTVCNKHGDGGFTDEDQRLLTIIAGQSAQVIDNARLIEERERLVRIEKEMGMAYEIQMELLPKQAPAVPGYDIAGTSRPAETVGGDYFDFIATDSPRLAVVVGDVSGKGMPAALLMANVQATMRAQALWDASPHATLERANTLLCRSVGKGSFVTLFYGMLDPEGHQLCYANAGHNRPVLLRSGSPPQILETAGLVLGFRSPWPYDEAVVSLHPGDVLVIYSDGITEATDVDNEQYGEERLNALLQAHRDSSARTLVATVLEAVQRHAAGTRQTDDMTIVVVRRQGGA